jgi:hypothetical protein
MATQHTFEDQGKVQPKPDHEKAAPNKAEGPVTVSELGGKLSPDTITRMQQTVGNAAVQRFLAQRSGVGTSEVDDETQASINSKRGSGQALDGGIAAKAGSAMDHDFSDVNVHTDSQSDQLNNQIGAKAFTTGNDIYFKEGAYDPNSGDGQRLISHELTHVVQQSGNTSPGEGKMSVNDPNDQYEGEADSVAESVMNMSEQDVAQRQEEEMLQPKLQAEGEEEEMMMMQPKLQAEGEEEEMMMMQPKLQAQEEEEAQLQPVEEEEEELQPKLQMQDEEEAQLQPVEEEEESLQPKLQMQDMQEEEPI